MPEGMRTTANTKAKKPADAPMAEGGRAAATRTTTTKSSAKKSSGKSIELSADNPIPAGTKVTIHRATDTDVQRRNNQAPSGEKLASATVKDDGSISVSGLKPGAYVAVGATTELSKDAISDDRFYQYVQFTVKS